MFTGLIDDVGRVERVGTSQAGLDLRISCRYDDLAVGESVAVSGVCLTVRESAPGSFSCAAMVTTTGVTTLGSWKAGRRVNLERAVRAGDRLGGHIVQGHVDGMAAVRRAEVVQDALLLELALPDGMAELMVERGSVAVDGVSLTISSLPAADMIQVSVIEYTRRHTTLGELAAGDHVHVEADILAKHVKRLLGR